MDVDLIFNLPYIPGQACKLFLCLCFISNVFSRPVGDASNDPMNHGFCDDHGTPQVAACALPDTPTTRVDSGFGA